MAWRGFLGRQVSQPPDGVHATIEKQTAAEEVQALTDPRELLRMHRQRLSALRLESGLAAEPFERLIGAVLYRAAEYVHLLPATRAEHHAEPGGLFRLAVESASLALRCADGKFLGATASTPMQGRECDRVRRYAVFLSALLLPLGRCATHARVCAYGRQELWNPYQEPLWIWAKRVDAAKLDIQWCLSGAKPAQAAAIWIAARVVPPAALNYLRSAEESLVEKVLQVLTDEPGAGRLGEIVRQAYRGAIDQDLARMPQPRGVPKQSIDPIKLLDVERLGPQAEGIDPAEARIPIVDLEPMESPGDGNTALEAPPEPQSPPAMEVTMETTPAAQDRRQAPSQPSFESPDPAPASRPPEDAAAAFKSLNRFGEVGQILKALAQRLLAEPGGPANRITQLIAMEEGVALAYPEAIAPFCQDPQQFLLACEAQGLLVADKTAGRRTLRTRPPGQSNLPEHYVVLSARVAKYLPLRADASP